jgi:molybdenum cofactor cytidylyltransferase
MHIPPLPVYNTPMHTQRIDPPIAAVVAAAGLSRRMGAIKQLLPWSGRTVIATVVDKLHAAGAAPILVVTGHRHAEVTAALATTAAQTVFNPDYATDEMLRSYQVGIDALREQTCAGALIALGDQPHLPVSVIEQVIAQTRATPDRIVAPSHNMRRGHPFFVPRTLWPEMLALSAEESLRTLVVRHQSEIVYVTVDTDAILRDMDTPVEFAQLQSGV